MGKHQRIRGLDPKSAAVAKLVKFYLDNATDPNCRVRLQFLQREMGDEDFDILCDAALGLGPRLMQQKRKGTTAGWKFRIIDVLDEASRHYDELTREVGRQRGT
jgi:hypothetical protein